MPASMPVGRSGGASRPATRATGGDAGAPPGRAPLASRMSARACTVGASNSVTDGSVIPNSFLTRVSICSATSELPPRSKKLSLVPIGSTPSTEDHTRPVAAACGQRRGVRLGQVGRGKPVRRGSGRHVGRGGGDLRQPVVQAGRHHDRGWLGTAEQPVEGGPALPGCHRVSSHAGADAAIDSGPACSPGVPARPRSSGSRLAIGDGPRWPGGPGRSR